jgi:HK97 family phage portal protein
MRSALRAIASDSKEQARAIIPMTTNGNGGTQQMTLVRSANPGEYRYDGSTIRAQGFNRHPVVHACIRAVADIVASVPLVVLRDRADSETRVGEAHPLQKLLDYPGPRFTARQFRARYAVDFLGYGNAFFQIERPSENGLPRGLRAVNAESIQQVWIDVEGDARRYDYLNWAGITQNIRTEDMLHFRDIDMGRPATAEVFGYPRGATAIGSIMADGEATQYVRQIVTNDGTPTFAVLLSDEATSDDAAAMQERYKARVVDRGKRGTPAFFGSVSDIKPLGFTLSDLEFPDLRRVSREDICAAFGVDPRMVGIASASSDAGLSGVQYAEARARLVQHTIEPMLSAFEDELNHWLAPEYGDVWITYDRDVLREIVENDTETSTRVRAEYEAGLRTWEESRVAINLAPLPEPTESVLKIAGRDLIPAAAVVIDPKAIDDETATDVAIDAMPSEMATSDENIQATALNGAQVSSLIELLNMLSTQQLPASTVDALIKAAFPLVPTALIDQMLAGLDGFTPKMSAEESAAEGAAMPEMDEEEEESEEEESGEEEVKADNDAEEEEVEASEKKRSDDVADAAMIRKRAIWERANNELDRTESVYYTQAKQQLNAEGDVVTRAIASSLTTAYAKARVRKLYEPDGAISQSWQTRFTPIIAKSYGFGATEVAGVGASLSADVAESGITRSTASVKKAVRKRAANLAKQVGRTTANEVIAVVEAATKADLTLTETARLVARAIYGEERVDARARH